jgi:hypothetical protein
MALYALAPAGELGLVTQTASTSVAAGSNVMPTPPTALPGTGTSYWIAVEFKETTTVCADGWGAQIQLSMEPYGVFPSIWTATAITTSKNERRSRFLGWGRLRFLPVRPTPRDSVRSARPSPRGRLKNLSTGENEQHSPLSCRGGRWGGCPRFGRPSSGFSKRAHARLRPSQGLPWALKRSALLEMRLGSLGPPRGRLSILRSTSRQPIDERRCRRTVPPNPPRVRRGARARANRVPRSGRRLYPKTARRPCRGLAPRGWPRSSRVDG